jgi:iron(II)-dependent oxidoreductase
LALSVLAILNLFFTEVDMLATRKARVNAGTLLKRLQDARLASDELFQIARPDSLYDRPIPERHRIIFYVGHLEAFDWNLLANRTGATKTAQPEFDRLFAFGIDPVGGGLPTDQPADWPSKAEVHRYRDGVREALDAGLSSVAASHDESQQSTLEEILQVAVEHRLMHLETLTYMLHQLPLDKKIRRPQDLDLRSYSIQPRMVEIPAGAATLGLSRNEPGAFGWDNEFDQHEVHVPAFQIDELMVTNAQFLQFLDAGGYDNKNLWNEAGWEWKTKQGIRHPAFWKLFQSRWHYRGMFDEILLPPDWPVYVSQAEASAYARWAGKSLPTEAQWHRAAYGSPEGSESLYPWGADPISANLGNFDFQNWDPGPVNAFPRNKSAFGVAGQLGNGWEWTSTIFAPFSGFQARPFYPGYSADFFDGKHFVMKGGSSRTAECMLRRSFRNWFQPHYQYAYAGFRCVSNASDSNGGK